jgi:hypothetical protein
LFHHALLSPLHLAQTMLRPRVAYREHAREDVLQQRATGIRALKNALALLFALGLMIAYTATDRLNTFEWLSAVFSFAYVPFAHLIGVALATRLLVREVKPIRAYALYSDGYGPACLALILIAAGCLGAPQPAALVPWFGLLLIAAWGWGGVLTFFAFRLGLETTRARALGAVLVIHLVTILVGLLIFASAGQLLPLFDRGA